jgi:hypothetical protein
MDLAILGLTVSSVSAMGAILAAVSFWLNRGKVEERADQALSRAKEGNDRYDRIMSAFADYRAAIAADIAIVEDFGGDKYRRPGLSGTPAGGRNRADEHSLWRAESAH